jgi:hypothetical protein
MFWFYYLRISLAVSVILLVVHFGKLLIPKKRKQAYQTWRGYKRITVVKALIFLVLLNVTIGFTWIVSLPYLLIRWLIHDDEED